MNEMVVFICLAVCYGALKIILERYLAPLDTAGDNQDLSDVAFSTGCSVFRLFQRAGDEWHFSNAKVGSDFKTYLNTGDIPGYVRMFIKQQPIQKRDRTYNKLIFSGGRPPYL
jgi:hypothetical protein